MPHSPLSPTARRAAVLLAGVLGLALAGCAPLPDIAAQTNTVRAVPAPRLVPIDGLLAQADAVDTGTGAVDPVTARADVLRARAEALRSQ